MTRKKQTVKKAGKWDAEIKKKRIIRTGLPAAMWPKLNGGGIVFGRDMVIGKGQAGYAKAEPRLTKESGKAATDNIIAALREEFGPDLSVIISIESKDRDGRRPLVTATDANTNHLKVHLLEMLKFAAQAE